jgi:anti-sigma factor RsiW
MTDCTNLEMRDLLPDLARGALTGPSLVAVERHLATCASCRAELALVRSARTVLSVAPAVDASRIAAAVVRARATRRITIRRVWLAAASVIAIVGAAALARSVGSKAGEPELAPIVVQREAPSPRRTAPDSNDRLRSATRPAARAELVVGGGVSDLADADLESLLRMLDGLDAQLDVEPAALLPLLEEEV